MLAFVERNSLAFVLLLFAVALAFTGPFATNDGPVHVAFARLLWAGPNGPLQAEVYAAGQRLVPNLLGYWIAGPLIPLIGSDGAEAVIQFLCLAALPVGGAFVGSAFGSPGGVFPVLFAALGLHLPFFLGLYNFSLSLGLGLIAFGALVRALRTDPRWWLVFSAALAACFLSHAGGFVMALLLTVAWTMPRLAFGLRSRKDARACLRKIAPPALALLPALALAAAYAAQAEPAEVAYGSVVSRLRGLVRHRIFAINGPHAWVAPTLLALMLVGLAAGTLLRRLQAAWHGAASVPDIVGLVLVLAGALALYLGFPDSAGGGWTHGQRMLAVFWVCVAVVAAAGPPGAVLGRASLLAASSVLAAMLGAAVVEQRQIRETVRQVDHLLDPVPPRCTILPLITDARDLGTRRASVAYSPLYHVATRAEEARDRVALFNYLARLSAYPVTYREGKDPHAGMFGWPPMWRGTDVTEVDIARYVRQSGLAVDYILLQGRGTDRLRLPEDLPLHYHPVAEAPEAGTRLLRRASLGEGVACS